MTENVAYHYIIVHELVDNENPEWEIHHPAGCPVYEAFKGVFVPNCTVGQLITEMGLDAFGEYGQWPSQVPRCPGRYPIEPWCEKYYSHYYGSTEYDTGLRVIEEAGP